MASVLYLKKILIYSKSRFGPDIVNACLQAYSNKKYYQSLSREERLAIKKAELKQVEEELRRQEITHERWKHLDKYRKL